MKRFLFLFVFFAAGAHAQPWSGIVAPARAMDWSNAGLGANVPIPSILWTQCGSTIAAYTGTDATITNALTTCPNFTYVLLGPGTFTLSSPPNFGHRSHVALRGSGGNSTHMVITPGAAGCNTGNSQRIGVCGPDATIASSPPANIMDWSAGYAQGATQITLSNTTGLVLAGSVANSPSFIMLNQDDDGYTGFPAAPTGTCNTLFSLTNPLGSSCSHDNGGLWFCSDHFFSGPFGCSDNGPDGSRGATPPVGNCTVSNCLNSRYQYQMVVATAINQGGCGANCVTISPPLRMPNWRTSQTPKAYLLQTIQDDGVEELDIDVQNSGNFGIAFWGCYKCWVSGVRSTNGIRGLAVFLSTHMQIQNNYFANTAGGDPYCLILSGADDTLIVNNIFHTCKSSLVFDGEGVGTVIAYNFSVNQTSGNVTGNEGMIPCFWLHSSGDDYVLYEGNICDAPAPDDIHGGHHFVHQFRNFYTGWESCGNGQCGAKTSKGYPNSGNGTYPMGYRNDNRYGGIIGNVLGTPGFHDPINASTGYNLNGNEGSGNSGHIYSLGNGNISPYDVLVRTTAIIWGNYDVYTAKNQTPFTGVRFCGNSSDTNWTTNCGSTSEIPTGAPSFPSPVPTVGDTAIGQAPLPPSFYLSSKPPWWANAIPWPPIGPDVTNGNIGQCSGYAVPNPPLAGLPSPSTSKCGAFTKVIAWGGHVNMNPAYDCFINRMGGLIDGTNPTLAFDDVTICPYNSGPAAPFVTFSPTSLNFGSLTVGTNTTQPTTLTNSGTAPLVISAISIVGATDFTQTNTCGSLPATIAAGNNCTFTIKFAPTIVGAESANLSVTDNASGSPQTVPLTGTGIAAGGPVVSFTPAGTLAFGNQNVGSTSSPLSLLVTNTGSSNLILASSNAVVIGGSNPTNFAIFSNTCTNGLNIIPSGSCTIQLTFTPSGAGGRSATVTVSGNASGVENLTGTGVAVGTPIVQFTPSPNMNFGSQTPLVPGTPQTLTVTNIGSVTLSLAGSNAVTISGTNAAEFSISGSTCLDGATIVSGGSCQIQIIFTPAALGLRQAQLNLTDNAPGSPQIEPLFGVGGNSAPTAIMNVSLSGEFQIFGQVNVQ